MTATQTLVSVGTLAERCHKPVAAVLAAATELKTAPAMRLDCTPFFEDQDADKIELHLRQVKEAR
jgi:hypothetical protein